MVHNIDMDLGTIRSHVWVHIRHVWKWVRLVIVKRDWLGQTLTQYCETECSEIKMSMLFNEDFKRINFCGALKN